MDSNKEQLVEPVGATASTSSQQDNRKTLKRKLEANQEPISTDKKTDAVSQEGPVASEDLAETKTVAKASAGKIPPGILTVRQYSLILPLDGPPIERLKYYLARKDGTDEYYVIKVLAENNEGEAKVKNGIDGETLIHTEYSILLLLKDEEGIARIQEMFTETIQEKITGENGEIVTKDVSRTFLVTDCFVGHKFSPKYANLTNLNSYVINIKKFNEFEAIPIFWKIVTIVERLHKRNVVHKDLKLANIVVNKDTKEVTIINFFLAKDLVEEGDRLKDLRGSPVYMAPEILRGRPYLGKPADMWSLGVVLYTMLFGCYPFFEESQTLVFRKIKRGQYQFPGNANVSQKTIRLIKALLVQKPIKRLTIAELREKLEGIMAEANSIMSDSLQVLYDRYSDD